MVEFPLDATFAAAADPYSEGSLASHDRGWRVSMKALQAVLGRREEWR